MTRSILFLVIALVQPLAGRFSQLTGLGQSIGARAREGGIPPELPLGIFFAIWGVIFLIYFVCAILSFGAPRGSAIDRAATPLVLAGAGNIAWMLSSQLVGNRLLDLALILLLLGLTLWAMGRAAAGHGRSLIVNAETGLLAGWLTAASAISFAPAIRPFLEHGVSDAVWGYASLTAGVALIGFILAWTRVARNRFYVIALGWGLLGLVLNNLQRTELDLIGWMFAALLAGVILATRPDRWMRAAR